MAVVQTWFSQDLQKAVKVNHIDGNLFSNNGNGNLVGVRVYNDGEPVTLTGTVSGYVITSDGSTVPCVGARSGNEATITIPPAAYQPGNAFITIFLTDGSTVTTLCAAQTTVLQARTGSQVSPGSVVQDWTQTINAAMQSVENAAENLGGIIATPYASLTYPVPLGKYTYYNNGLYRCISPIETSEEFTAAHWTQVKLGDDVTSLKSAFNGFTDANIVAEPVILEATSTNYNLTTLATTMYVSNRVIPANSHISSIDIWSSGTVKAVLINSENIVVHIFNINEYGGLKTHQLNYYTLEDVRFGLIGLIAFSGSGVNVDEAISTTGLYESDNYAPVVGDVITIRRTTATLYRFCVQWHYSTFGLIDSIDELQNDLGLIRDLLVNNKIVNTFNESTNYTVFANDNIYLLASPLNTGVITNIKLSAGTSGVIKCYLFKRTGDTVIVEDVIDLNVNSSGTNAYEINKKITGEAWIGFKGRNVFKYINSDDEETYGTVNSPVISIEGEELNKLETGANLTIVPSAHFVYAVEIEEVVPVNSGETDEVSYKLETGLMLRYEEIENNVGFMGRWFDYETGGNTYKCTNNQGSEIYIKTTDATSLTLTFGQITAQAVTPYIAYSVDGSPMTRVQITNPIVISLSNTTDNNQHIIRIVIDGITEKQAGNKWEGTLGVYLISAVVNTGTMVGLKPRNRVGMFFGDSITEGINALGTGANAAVNSAIGAYPWFCCLSLGAVSFRVGYGATGVEQIGSFNKFINAINYLKDGLRTPVYYPDFIVINHGNNDVGSTVATFKADYLIAVSRLHIMYPDIPIFMVSYFKGTKFDTVMKEIANADPLCYFIDTNGWGGATTDGTHLSVAGAQNNGTKLADAILEVMGKSYFMN